MSSALLGGRRTVDDFLSLCHQLSRVFVREIMSTDVVTAPASASLESAVGNLLGAEVGSVVVVSDSGDPVGIVTETDVVRATYETGRPLADIPVDALSHRPVVTTKPDATVPFVASKMSREGVKKVPVLDDLALVGIVTLSDVVWHLSDLRQEVAANENPRGEWSGDD